MTEAEYNRRLEDIERLLNDPDIPFDPARIWSLLSDVAPRAASESLLTPAD